MTVDAPGCYEFHFETAYSPPVPVWEKMAKMFPALEFSLSGGEPMMEFAFKGTIQGGKLELEISTCLLNPPTRSRRDYLRLARSD